MRLDIYNTLIYFYRISNRGTNTFRKRYSTKDYQHPFGAKEKLSYRKFQHKLGHIEFSCIFVKNKVLVFFILIRINISIILNYPTTISLVTLLKMKVSVSDVFQNTSRFAYCSILYKYVLSTCFCY